MHTQSRAALLCKCVRFSHQTFSATLAPDMNIYYLYSCTCVCFVGFREIRSKNAGIPVSHWPPKPTTIQTIRIHKQKTHQRTRAQHPKVELCKCAQTRTMSGIWAVLRCGACGDRPEKMSIIRDENGPKTREWTRRTTRALGRFVYGRKPRRDYD